ncbi:hypothetical protein BgiBS90_028161 [Biomphalaria glabrata]|nr:hypothetical protein BgiBS90_028161 [Biomphalaria glabrata]
MPPLQTISHCSIIFCRSEENRFHSTSTDQGMEITCIGEHESQFYDGCESALEKLFEGCTKNPGHANFIPVNTFGLEHLPEGYRDTNVLYELVKAIAELTVRIQVNTVSPYRPEFWPESTVPYPCFGLKEREILRTGSGRIRSVIKYDNGYNKFDGKHKKDHTACTCHKCQQSDMPCTIWWEAELLTATSLVFDDEEVRSSSCRLFYDTPDSPVVSLDKITVDNVNIVEDRCLLICVSCDVALMERLEKTVELFDELMWDVHAKYKASRDVDKLTFVVSHPHGYLKQVSIGQWKNVYQVGVFNFKNRFTYTAGTCPGCTGAPVYFLGYSWWGRWWSQHVHSGTLSSGLSCSGVGDVL